MKELSIEEKAKRYDEAICKLRGMIPNWERLSYNGKTFLQDLIYILPELKESEDERIRKALIQSTRDTNEEYFYEEYGVHKEDAISWLEKQGEQKPVDKVEPKFKVGDSISKKHNSDINKFGIFTITSIADNKYWYNDSVICDFSDQDLWEFVEQTKFKKGDWVFHNTAEFIYMIQTIGRDGYGVIRRDGKKSVVSYSAEINYRLWTIQDAKKGDVLVADYNHSKYIFIFKEIDEHGITWGYCDVNEQNSELCIDERTSCYSRCLIKPSTLAQKNELFRVLEESGYQWDSETKTLSKIEEPQTCMYANDKYTNEERKALCEGCEEECEYKPAQEPQEPQTNCVS